MLNFEAFAPYFLIICGCVPTIAQKRACSLPFFTRSVIAVAQNMS